MDQNKLNYCYKSFFGIRNGILVLPTLIKHIRSLAIVVLATAATSTINDAKALTEDEKARATYIIIKSYLDAKIPPRGVCVYSKTRFRGHRQCFTDSVVKLNERLNNQGSSIKVSSEYKLTAYQDENFAGGFISYSVDSATLDVNLDDTITSVAVAFIGDPTINPRIKYVEWYTQA